MLPRSTPTLSKRMHITTCKMGRIDNGKGSQRALIETVRDRSSKAVLEEKLREAFPKWEECTFKWLSPIEDDGYKEYTGKRFWEMIYSSAGKTPLTEISGFWPLKGCHWDGVVEVLQKGRRVGIILIEAKAHSSELRSTISARSETSIRIILDTLRKVKSELRVSEERDWTGQYYQSANRIAHVLHLNSRDILKPITYALANLYFLNDKFAGEKCNEHFESEKEWTPFIKKEYDYLGITPEDHPLLKNHIKNIFIDAPEY